MIAICRGMQFINVYFGGELSKIKNHAGDFKHKIKSQININKMFPTEVNTFHNYGIPRVKCMKCFDILALDEDGNVEAFKHKGKNLMGIMWHPERNIPHNELEETAYAWAQEILEKSPTSIKMLKFAMNLTDDGMVGQQVFAGEATRLAYMTDEAKEGINAFLEKRKPNFPKQWIP